MKSAATRAATPTSWPGGTANVPAFEDCARNDGDAPRSRPPLACVADLSSREDAAQGSGDLRW
jgi:hypothetical protein